MTKNETETQTGDLVRPSVSSRLKKAVLETPLVAGLITVNAAAVYGQTNWAFEHVVQKEWSTGTRWFIAAMFAFSIEIIGAFLAIEAHKALLANQSAGLLRFGSYFVGLVAGVLNYAHFTPNLMQPHATGVTFGLLSAISPWLWAIRSRSMHRSRLAELGLVDPRGVKLSTTRKFWHPIKSMKAMSYAAWSGETRPVLAVRDWENSLNKTETAQVQTETPATETETVIETPVQTVIETETETAPQVYIETKRETANVIPMAVSRSAHRAAQIEAVKSAFPSWTDAPIPLKDIKAVIEINGQATAMKIRDALKTEAREINPTAWEVREGNPLQLIEEAQ